MTECIWLTCDPVDVKGYPMAGAPLPPGETGLPLYRAFDVVIAQPQDLSLDWSRVPREPREGLRASVKRRQPSASCFT
jgi:hypothetical protein